MGTCPPPDLTVKVESSPKTQEIMGYITTLCAMIAAVLSLIARGMHVFRYRVPAEQRQIIRILVTPVLTAACCVGSVWKYETALYLQPIAMLYESFAFSSLFLLFCQFAVPGTNYKGADFWETLITDAYNPDQKKRNKGNWPKNTWIWIFQFPLLQLVGTLIQISTQATDRFCTYSFKPQYASLWVFIINYFSSTGAIMCMYQFYRRTKGCNMWHRGKGKLYSFKSAIFLQFFQTFLIQTLLWAKAIKPTKIFSYEDLYFGIPMTLWAIESLLLSITFFYTFSVSEYSSKERPNWPKLPWYRATLDALDPRDVLLGIWRALLLLFRLDPDSAAYKPKDQLLGKEPLQLPNHQGGTPEMQPPNGKYGYSVVPPADTAYAPAVGPEYL